LESGLELRRSGSASAGGPDVLADSADWRLRTSSLSSIVTAILVLRLIRTIPLFRAGSPTMLNYLPLGARQAGSHFHILSGGRRKVLKAALNLYKIF